MDFYYGFDRSSEILRLQHVIQSSRASKGMLDRIVLARGWLAVGDVTGLA